MSIGLSNNENHAKINNDHLSTNDFSLQYIDIFTGDQKFKTLSTKNPDDAEVKD